MRATVANLAAAVRAAGAERAETYAWLDRVEAVCLAPADVADTLVDLADLADLAQAHPELVTPDGALRLLRDRLQDLAWQVVPS
jgi:hypothetical protein